MPKGFRAKHREERLKKFFNHYVIPWIVIVLIVVGYGVGVGITSAVGKQVLSDDNPALVIGTMLWPVGLPAIYTYGIMTEKLD